jgi:hypothetical protein
MTASAAKAPSTPLQEGEGTLWESFWCSSQDGLRLHNRLYGSPHLPRVPVVCLPGLARTSADFHEIATLLSSHRSAAVPIMTLIRPTTIRASKCRMFRMS